MSKTINAVEVLVLEFRVVIEKTREIVEREGLPLYVFETLRTSERQNALLASGVSNAAALKSPHQWGCAADWVIDPKHRYWAEHGAMPLLTPALRVVPRISTQTTDCPPNWDQGVELEGGKPVLKRAGVLEVWKALGRAIKLASGLDPERSAPQVWGGDWYERGAAPLTHFMGWDCGHTQHAEWRAIAAKLKVPPTAP